MKKIGILGTKHDNLDDAIQHATDNAIHWSITADAVENDDSAAASRLRSAAIMQAELAADLSIHCSDADPRKQ